MHTSAIDVYLDSPTLPLKISISIIAISFKHSISIFAIHHGLQMVFLWLADKISKRRVGA